eukprot:1468271-Rhodomonas_salina.3
MTQCVPCPCGSALAAALRLSATCMMRASGNQTRSSSLRLLSLIADLRSAGEGTREQRCV